MKMQMVATSEKVKSDIENKRGGGEAHDRSSE
jgi:hypothetical protein